MYVFPKLPGDVHFIHVSIHQYELSSELILMLPGPQDYFHNLIDNVSVDHEPEAKAQYGIVGLDGVHRGDITVGDGCDGVDAPVQCVKVL